MPARTNSVALWGSDGPSSKRSSVAADSSTSAQLDMLQQIKALAEAARQDRLAGEAAAKKMAELAQQVAADKKAAEEVWQRIPSHERYAAGCADRAQCAVQQAECAVQEARQHAGQASQASYGATNATAFASQFAAVAAQSATAAHQSATRFSGALDTIEGQLGSMESNYVYMSDSIDSLERKVFNY